MELLVLLDSKNINPPYLTEGDITYKVEIKLIAGSMPVYDDTKWYRCKVEPVCVGLYIPCQSYKPN